MSDQQMTYRSAGVDIDEAQRALRAVVGEIQDTHNENVLGGVGGFGALYRASFGDYERPILVSSIDGIGTKTKVAAMVGEFEGLGHDIVNHCINDILCQGAKPLFFLDYYGTSRLRGEVFEQVLRGMAAACKETDVALIGGETAEMPDVYHDDEIDIVGTVVGIVDAEKKLPRQKVQVGDVVIGLASNGLHTNGYSLARRALFEMGGMSTKDLVPGLNTTIGEELLRPHKCYLKALLPLIEEGAAINAAAHITGGGFFDNIPRVLSSDMQVLIDKRAWTPQPIFSLIRELGNVPEPEMYRIFNMGIGMVLLVDKDHGAAVVQRLTQAGEAAAVIGTLQNGAHDVQVI
ncbi:MAG: phosphoribosylformylglycinamidine cyclo-ligase [Fimbriimonadaceae bacterium]|nr:phosphoribosylformylglycinamidine cyclo-ligase [Fimbriimonadaceae bacterium]